MTKRVNQQEEAVPLNEAFFALPQEKRQRIINAALEVFAQNEYKRASTDDIAARAGISKGLLFYYFHNKRELYVYLFRYAAELLGTVFAESPAASSTDFFMLLEQGSALKLEIMEKSPAIMDFCVRAYYERESEAAAELNQTLADKLNVAYTTYFSKVDFSKFREGIDPMYVFQMLTWMTDGYLHEKQRLGQPIQAAEIMSDFHVWAEHFKKMAYKEEYL